jgi:aryl-alcohol dehydrogenase-like predicted oxidoreductase
MQGGTDEAEAIRTIHEAVDCGITLIDTAPVYGFGRSEEIVGKALAEGGRRKRVLIASKVGLDWKEGQPFCNASKTRIHKEIEDSCSVCAPMSSSSIRCIGPIPTCRSRKPRQRWRTCSAPARFG